MSRQRAFTLVEVLVVVLISAVLASITLLSLRDTSEDYFLREDLTRLAAVLERNCRDALMSGQHLGVSVDESGYDVLRWDGRQWINIGTESTIYRHHAWSNSWALELELQGQHTVLRDTAGAPQLVCLAGGDLLPFELTLSGADNLRLSLSGYGDGRLSIGDTP